MCDRLSHRHGYICNECYEELVETNYPNWEEFMKTRKDEQAISPDSFKRMCEEEFPITRRFGGLTGKSL